MHSSGGILEPTNIPTVPYFGYGYTAIFEIESWEVSLKI